MTKNKQDNTNNDSDIEYSAPIDTSYQPGLWANAGEHWQQEYESSFSNAPTPPQNNKRETSFGRTANSIDQDNPALWGLAQEWRDEPSTNAARAQTNSF